MSVKSLKISKLFLALIILFFLIMRLYKISEIPPSVYWDEASIGYNAYSILQTGKDEWGEAFPIHFRAFGEFKLPIYIYSIVPFVKLFGLNELSVRVPAVLFSLGTVILTYLLAKKI
jgi:4-amino-4-deoxy-L-arabinose transferase-like glycosyltransferase